MVGLIAGAAAASVLAFFYHIRTAAEKTKDKSEQFDKLSELSRLTGGLAHEIKNPLSTIKVNLKLIAEDMDEHDHSQSRAMRKLAVVQKETDRLAMILDDFLRYIGRTQLQLEPVDVNKLVGDMADFYSPQAHQHNITVRTMFASEPIICKLDADVFRQVILNLMLNAQQAMAGGGDLMIRAAKNGKKAVITISDTGKGIEPVNLTKIFDAYYSLKPGGGGLGLSIAKKIIDAHNGVIEVNSEVGKGTSFRIELPLEQNIKDE